MPEAAIHEDRELLLWKDEIRAAGDRIVSTPTRNAMRSEQPSERDFRVLVAFAPDAGHHLGTLGLGEDVGHLLK